MKTLRMIGMALVAVVMCAGFAACSDDEEGDNPSSALAGTTWTVVSADESYMEGSVYTFHADGTVSSDPSQGGMRYTESGSTLRLDFEDGAYIAGTLSVDGHTAVYRYSWHYTDGSTDGEYVMTLQKDSSAGGNTTDDGTDDEPSQGGGEDMPYIPLELEGTAWTVTSADEEEMVGFSFAFIDGEHLVSTPSLGEMTYSVEARTLKIVYPDGAYTEGRVGERSGDELGPDKLDYTYFWHYPDGESDGPHNMTLQRK